MRVGVRVLWLTHMLPYPPNTGSLLRTYHLLREASRFATVDLLAFVQTALLPPGMDAEQATAGLDGVCRVRGVFRLPLESRAGKTLLAAFTALTGTAYTTRWTFSRRFREAVGRALRDGYDRLVLDTIGLARNVPASLDLPVILNHHNEEVSMLERRALAARAPASAYFALEARRLRSECLRFFPRVARHLVVSAPEGERLRALHPPARADVVPNGVDTAEYASVYRPGRGEPFTLVFIGGGDWYANRDAVTWLVREIWPLCRARVPSARLVLIGRSPTAESVEAARHDPAIVVTGYVPDIREWCARADAFVCPIRDGGGTRLKVLHALSMGLPVVSTAVGIDGIEARPGIDYLGAESAAEFADRIGDLAARPDEAARLSRAGRDLAVRRYDWQSVGAVLERSLVEAAAGAGRPGA